jgi:hypothetical protein
MAEQTNSPQPAPAVPVKERPQPVTAPPRRAENLFMADVTFEGDERPRRIALDIAGTRRPVSEEKATEYFRNRLGPEGDVVKVENVRRVTRAETGPTPRIPVVRNGVPAGAVDVRNPPPATPADNG